MYKIDKVQNRIERLTVKKFADLGFYEREHLQEWLANEPKALGEDLLIIQKEFDGFDDTNERLDLLALDKDGNLVVIENKLDDSGRDVVWQALKYASYCSTLKPTQIVELYQKYLNRCCCGGDSQALICEFLEVPDLGEAVLNSGQQRLILVAARFRKEVTSTALWLMSYKIRLQCFKVTPYEMGGDLFLNLEQIIPPPDAAEFMIGISEKEAAEKSTESELRSRHRLRLAFWEQTLEVLKKSSCDLFNNISPSKDHWLTAGSKYNLIFGNSFIRVELQMTRSNTEENKFIFDRLYTNKAKIEESFGHQLSWERLDDKKSCYIRYAKYVDGYNRENWPEMIEWLVEHIIKLEAAFRRPWADAMNALKKGATLTSLEASDSAEESAEP